MDRRMTRAALILLAGCSTTTNIYEGVTPDGATGTSAAHSGQDAAEDVQASVADAGSLESGSQADVGSDAPAPEGSNESGSLDATLNEGGGPDATLNEGGGSDASASDAESGLPLATMFSDSACKAGFYEGTFTGTYSSHITVVGIGIPMSGNVDFTLNQEGTASQTCMIDVQGEGTTTESCNDVFTLSGGAITGTMDGLFPYYCTFTGTLDCTQNVLDNGWMECTYCAIGVIPDGGGAGGDALAATGAGGNFAGVLHANYDTTTLSFTDGVWNGAEDLCAGIGGSSLASCNDGGSPGPEGGPATNYLVADGGYGLAPNFGGAGTWSATCVNCEHD